MSASIGKKDEVATPIITASKTPIKKDHAPIECSRAFKTILIDYKSKN